MRKTLVLALCATLLGGCVVREYRNSTPDVVPVTKNEVLSLKAAGHPDSVILGRIRADGVDRTPGADDIVEMKNAGVSSAVLDEMLRAPVTLPQPARENRTVVVHNYSEPAILLGLGALTGYLMFRHPRPHVLGLVCVH
jgi:hypothetical protein